MALREPLRGPQEGPSAPFEKPCYILLPWIFVGPSEGQGSIFVAALLGCTCGID